MNIRRGDLIWMVHFKYENSSSIIFSILRIKLWIQVVSLKVFGVHQQEHDGR
jgi:hypothetical protein